MSSNKNERINITKRDENGKLHYYKDRTNQKYGKLTAIKFVGKNKRRKAIWLCLCDCGNYIDVASDKLTTRNTRSCGCMCTKSKKENIKKAIMHNTKYKNKNESKIMKIFNQMKLRCYSPKCKAYKNYGARGIKICSEWLENPKTFYNWAVHNGYKENLSIERIDIDGNYESNNCKWITMFEQQSNKQNSHFLEFNGEIHTVAEWSRILKIPSGTIHDRIRRNKNIEEILSIQKLKYRK